MNDWDRIRAFYRENEADIRCERLAQTARKGGAAMTREKAHALLDAARQGASIHSIMITRALRVTGDIGPWWSQHATESPPTAQPEAKTYWRPYARPFCVQIQT